MRQSFNENFPTLMERARIYFDVTRREPGISYNVMGISHMDSAGVRFLVQRTVHGSTSNKPTGVTVDWDHLDPIKPDGLGRKFR